MLNVDKSRLTKEMLKDVEEYERTGEDAIFLLAKRNSNYRDIITRMQSSNIAFIANSGVKSFDDWNNTWSLNAKINEDMVALNEDGGNQKYSCYALKAPNSFNQGLRLPFIDTYASKKKSLFAGNTTFSTYNSLIENISNSYKIKIKELNYAKKHIIYKNGSKLVGMLKDKAHRVLNMCRKFLHKEQTVAPIRYKGKIKITKYLNSISKSKYGVSQQERVTEILDKIMYATVKYFAKNDKVELTSKEMLVATLYADILMSRAINYGDVKNNNDIENALKLQLSNVLCTLEPGSDKLKQLAGLGMRTAIYNLEKMGISLDEVVENAKKCGFAYSTEPTNYEEALLGSKLKLQEKEVDAVEEKDNTASKQDEGNNEKAVENKLANITTSQKESEKDYQYFTINHDIPPFVDYKIPTSYAVVSGENKSQQKKEESVEPATKEVILTQKDARKYIDTVSLKAFKNYMAKSVVVMSGYANKTGKVYAKMQRRHLFVEDILAYYENNKHFDASQLVDDLNRLIAQKEGTDELQASKFANSLLTLRESIILDIFKDKQSIKATNGETISTLVNKFLADNYNATSLTPFINNVLKVSMKDIDKLSKPNTFENER